MHTVWNWRRAGDDNVLTNLEELHIISMDQAKLEYEKNPNDILAQWILFILNPNKAEVKDIKKLQKPC